MSMSEFQIELTRLLLDSHQINLIRLANKKSLQSKLNIGRIYCPDGRYYYDVD